MRKRVVLRLKPGDRVVVAGNLHDYDSVMAHVSECGGVLVQSSGWGRSGYRTAEVTRPDTRCVSVFGVPHAVTWLLLTGRKGPRGLNPRRHGFSR